MKLLIDMNLSPRWVEVLENVGFEAAHWSEVGAATDEEIMTFARLHNYVVITHDLDFGDILAATRDVKPSVVQIRADDITPERMAVSVVAALRQMADALDRGALLTIDVARARLRVLPLTGV